MDIRARLTSGMSFGIDLLPQPLFRGMPYLAVTRPYSARQHTSSLSLIRGSAPTTAFRLRPGSTPSPHDGTDTSTTSSNHTRPPRRAICHCTLLVGLRHTTEYTLNDLVPRTTHADPCQATCHCVLLVQRHTTTALPFL